MTIDSRNRRIYNKIITSNVGKYFYLHDLTGQIIRNVKIDKCIGMDIHHRHVYKCTCTKCGQEILLTTHMLSDKRYILCYCDHPDKRYENLGNYSKQKYIVNTRDINIKPLYNIWNKLRNRCNNPNNKDYKYYGGRGIKVCDEWNNNDTGFNSFYYWAIDSGWEPNKDYTIDRIDFNKNYTPENCRWISIQDQQLNKSSNRYLQYNQWIFPVSIWAKIVGLPSQTINTRIYNNWDIVDSLFTNTKIRPIDLLEITKEYEMYNKYDIFVNNNIIAPISVSLYRKDLPIVRDFVNYDLKICQ